MGGGDGAEEDGEDYRGGKGGSVAVICGIGRVERRGRGRGGC